MKCSELKIGDVVVVDYSYMGRPVVYYVVMGKVAVSFKGDVNCGDKPCGWLDEMNGDDDLPYHTVAVYRAKCVADIFNGDFENEDIYTCVYKKVREI